MGFIFDPARKAEAQNRLGELMREISSDSPAAWPSPWSRWFTISPSMSAGHSQSSKPAAAPICLTATTTWCFLPCCARDQRLLSACERSDLERFSLLCHDVPGALDRTRSLLDRLLPQSNQGEERAESLDALLAQNGFDPIQHERIQAELRAGHIGLAQNRFPASSSD